jgi:uncharacterized coiled-coil protein SlyX
MSLQVPQEVLWGVGGYVAAKAVEWVINLKREKDKILETKNQLQDETIKELSKKLEDNSRASYELGVHVKHLTDKIAPLPRIEKDVNEAHAKIRVLEARTSLADKEPQQEV